MQPRWHPGEGRAQQTRAVCPRAATLGTGSSCGQGLPGSWCTGGQGPRAWHSASREDSSDEEGGEGQVVRTRGCLGELTPHGGVHACHPHKCVLGAWGSVSWQTGWSQGSPAAQHTDSGLRLKGLSDPPRRRRPDPEIPCERGSWTVSGDGAAVAPQRPSGLLSARHFWGDVLG